MSAAPAWVTLKLATSLDGRIATASGESRWITGELARLEGRRLRALHDAVVVGIGTALADDPELSVREPGAGPEPWRVVLDTHARLPAQARMLRSPGGPVCVLTDAAAEQRAVEALQAAGAQVLPVEAGTAGLCPKSVVAVLAGLGLKRVMLEGGGQIAAAFLRAKMVDRLEWFRAGTLLGAEGRPAIGPLLLEGLAEAPRFRRLDWRLLGPDVWERFEREKAGCSPEL